MLPTRFQIPSSLVCAELGMTKPLQSDPCQPPTNAVCLTVDSCWVWKSQIFPWRQKSGRNRKSLSLALSCSSMAGTIWASQRPGIEP